MAAAVLLVVVRAAVAALVFSLEVVQISLIPDKSMAGMAVRRVLLLILILEEYFQDLLA